MRSCMRWAALAAAALTGGWPAIAGPPSGLQDPAVEKVAYVYGDEIERVRQTPDTKDDLDLATKLLEQVSAKPELTAGWCVKAYELAAPVRQGGQDVAEQAMELLAQKVPRHRPWCLDRIVTLRRRRYEASKGFDRMVRASALLCACAAAMHAHQAAGHVTDADRLCQYARRVAEKSKLRDWRAWLKLAAGRMKAAKKLAGERKRLQDNLKANPGLASARSRLIELHVIEYDSPEAALALLEEPECTLRAPPKLLQPGGGPADKARGLTDLTQRLRLATGKAADLSWAACLDMGEWYRHLSDKTRRDAARAALLRRGAEHLRACLTKLPEDNLDRARAEVSLREVEKDLRKLAARLEPPAGLIDLLSLVDLAKDRLCGQCRMIDGELLADGPAPLVMLPLVLRGGYELRAVFTIRRATKDAGAGLYLMLPTGKARAGLHVGQKLTRLVVKPEARQHVAPAVFSQPLRLGRKHAVEVRVRPHGKEVEFTMVLDGKKLSTWKGPQSALTPVIFAPDPRSPVLGAYCGEVICHSAYLRTRPGGKATPIRQTVNGKQRCRVPGEPLAKGKVADLLKMVDLDLDVIGTGSGSPKWVWGKQMGPGAPRMFLATAGLGRGSTLMPVAPNGPYRVRIDLTRLGQKTTVAVFLPVGGTAVALSLLPDKTALELVDGRPLLVPGKPAGGALVKGKKHTLDITVSTGNGNAAIMATLSGDPLISWKGLESALSVGPYLAGVWRGRRVGLWVASITGDTGRNVKFHRVEFWPLSDKAVRIR